MRSEKEVKSLTAARKDRRVYRTIHTRIEPTMAVITGTCDPGSVQGQPIQKK